MTEDPRCCGSGTCIIDTEGRCWCGQRWDGQKMCAEPLSMPAGASAPGVASPVTPGGAAAGRDTAQPN